MSEGELDVETLLRHAHEAIEAVGRQWVFKKVRDEKHGKGKLETHSYLFRPPDHPFVEWMRGFERFREECVRTRRFALSEDALKVAILGGAIELAKNADGYELARRRLRLPKEFLSAAFEIEVAASYLRRGYKVTFLEVGNERSPDLFVEPPRGVPFHVECKTREQLTEADRHRKAFWDLLASRLLRAMGLRKLNYAIFIRSLLEPRAQDARVFADRLIRAMERGVEIGRLHNNTFEPSIDFRSDFEVGAFKLAQPDIATRQEGFAIQSPWKDANVYLSAEAMRAPSGETFFRNPKALVLSCAKPSDRISGVVTALKSAVGQLPSSGPGLVWIRIADGHWAEDLKSSFEQAIALLSAELSGEHNRRVNGCNLMTRGFEALQRGEERGLGYRPVIAAVMHKNPRCAVEDVTPNSSTSGDHPSAATNSPR